jgi:hypothetical protein
MALHYGVAVMPARPYKPRDKAKVENAVLPAERWVIAALRQRKFFWLAGLNEGIDELVEKLNHQPFRKREGSRASLFAELDCPALQPLPGERYAMRSRLFCIPRKEAAAALPGKMIESRIRLPGAGRRRPPVPSPA